MKITTNISSGNFVEFSINYLIELVRKGIITRNSCLNIKFYKKMTEGMQISQSISAKYSVVCTQSTMWTQNFWHINFIGRKLWLISIFSKYWHKNANFKKEPRLTRVFRTVHISAFTYDNYISIPWIMWVFFVRYSHPHYHPKDITNKISHNLLL